MGFNYEKIVLHIAREFAGAERPGAKDDSP